MSNYKKAFLLVLILILKLTAIAQTSVSAGVNATEGVMASEGKIYVVMAIVMTILAGILLYIFRLDRKISNLEKGKYL